MVVVPIGKLATNISTLDLAGRRIHDVNVEDLAPTDGGDGPIL